MNNADVSRWLNILGYDATWFASGLLSEEQLRVQVAQFHEGDDKNTEHFRYASFRRVLAERKRAETAFLVQYIKLAQKDADPVMGRCALQDLLLWDGLEAAQFEMLRGLPAFQTSVLQRAAERRALVAALRIGMIKPQLFARCVESRDACIQRWLINEERLSADQLAILAEQGANRAVRNIARNKRSHVIKDEIRTQGATADDTNVGETRHD